MSIDSIVLFIHLLGVIGLFSGVAVTLLSVWGAARADDVKVFRAWAGAAALADNAMPVIAVVILAAGIYMVTAEWSWRIGWIDVSLAVFLAMFVLGPLVNARRLHALHKLAEQTPDGPVTAELRAGVEDPVLGTSLRIMTPASLGIVLLMATKPSAMTSIVTMAVAVAIGLALSLPLFRTSRGPLAERKSA